jgi:hypothetical protein
MGANPTQAFACVVFLLAFTVLSGAIYAGSVLLYLVALVLLVVSIGAFLKCKPLENAGN